MGFAIVAYFDKDSDEKIRSIWKLMADNGIDDYLVNSDNSAHFKLAMYRNINVNVVQKRLEKLTKGKTEINLHFKKFGFYPKKDKPFLTIDIAENEKVINLQDEIQNIFSDYSIQNCSVFFKKEIWKPDVQLTVGFDKDKLPRAVEALNEIELPFDGKLESIGLIEFHPAKQLFRYKL